MATCDDFSPLDRENKNDNNTGDYEEDYSLLNAFEMLWNLESSQTLKRLQQKALDRAESKDQTTSKAKQIAGSEIGSIDAAGG